MMLGKSTPEKIGKEADTVVPRARLALPMRVNNAKGWLAPAYIDDVFLLLTADTGAAVTMLSSGIFKRYFPNTELEPCTGNFTTANNEPMPTEGSVPRQRTNWTRNDSPPDDNSC